MICHQIIFSKTNHATLLINSIFVILHRTPTIKNNQWQGYCLLCIGNKHKKESPGRLKDLINGKLDLQEKAFGKATEPEKMGGAFL